MKVQTIGENAGIVWQLLNGDNRAWEFNEIKKATGLSSRDLNTAIGWLAREDKIQIEENDGTQDDRFYIAMNYYIG